MKKTTMILGIILILMATIVTALEYGDIIPISQIENWDLSTINLQRQHVNYEVRGQEIIEVSKIAGLKKVNDTHAEFIQRKLIANGLRLDLYKNCIDNPKYTLQDCNAWGRMTLDLNMDKREDDYRKNLVKIWQPEDVEQYTLE